MLDRPVGSGDDGGAGGAADQPTPGLDVPARQTAALEEQIEEAQALAEELELTNAELHETALELKEARDAARASEARYRALVEASTLMVWRTDADGMVEDMPVWRELTGQTLEQVRGAGWADALHPEDRPRVAAAWRAVYESRAPYDVEYRLRLRDGSYRWFRARAVPVLDGGGVVAEWVGVFDDVDATRRERERKEFLERASNALATVASVEDALRAVARVATTPGDGGSSFADGVAIDRPRPAAAGGGFERVAVESRDPAKRDLVLDIERVYPTPPDAPVGYANVLRTGEPELVRDVEAEVLPRLARDARHLAMLRAMDVYSVIAVPLRARGETLGAATFVLHGPERRRPFDDGDVALAMELARRAGFALDNALRYDAERAAAERARRLLAAAAGLAEAMTPEDVADVIFREGMVAVGADAGSLALLHAEGDDPEADAEAHFEVVRTAGYAEETAARFARFPLRRGRPLSDAVVSRAPVLVESAAEWARRYPEQAADAALPFESLALLPIMLAGRPVAALSFSFRAPRTFDEAERTFLATLGEQCGLALERARAFAGERREREFSAGILVSIRDGFAALDAGYRYLFVNERAAEILRTPRAELLGRSMWDVFPQAADTPMGRATRRAMESREVLTVEQPGVVTGGWTEARFYPRSDGGLSVFFQDTTERHRAQEASDFLAEASRLLSSSLDMEETLRTLAHSAVPRLGDWCAIDLVSDPDAGAWPPVVERLAVAHVDPEKVGLATELARVAPTDWGAPRGLPRVLREGVSEMWPVVTEAMTMANARSEEHRRVLRTLRIASAIVVPLLARGRTLGALTVVTSESGRHYDDGDLRLVENLAGRAAVAVDNARLFRDAERARREAEEANKAKSEFLATMSHELRTPLNAIGGYTELVELGIHGPITDAQREAFSRIQASQRHLLMLINDILNFARIEAGRVDLDVRPLPAQDVLGEIEALVAPQVAAKGLRYEIAECPTPPAVLADRDRLHQVLLNLVSNAVKATPAGGTITLACAGRAAAGAGARDVVAFTVTDTGVGIPADKLQRIFEPFVQLDRGHATPKEGIGLGLAISRDLARAMGGELTVESEPGRGATFTLFLPAVHEA